VCMCRLCRPVRRIHVQRRIEGCMSRASELNRGALLTRVTNWGNYPVTAARVASFSTPDALAEILGSSPEIIARGQGRCYGDSSLNADIVSTRRFNRMLDFDEGSGVLTCESGVTLEEILEVFVPRGWFLPTTPGTKYVSVGGAIASDVHGKNHHAAGSFSRHVVSLDVMLSDGSVMTCSNRENSALFWSTCGGMGLTGVILRAAFRLQPVETAYMTVETVAAGNLDEIMDIFEESAPWAYSVAWLDCLATGKRLGRSVLTRGRHAAADELAGKKCGNAPLKIPKKRRAAVPFYLPGFTMNRYSISLFNTLMYAAAPKRVAARIVDYDSFFYPLDRIHRWNRIYGKKGFVQYQFVLPVESSREGISLILKQIAGNRLGSFLAVLKLFGRQDNLISFPMEGYTLALDFPVSARVFRMLDELDALVLDYGGRLYLTKDARMSGSVFRQGYAGAESFINLKHAYDRERKFQSLQSKRIGI